MHNINVRRPKLRSHTFPMLTKIIKISILVSWFVMLGFLIERTFIRPSSVIALDVITEEGVRTGDEWFGIYQQGRKIGYAHTRITPEADTYHITEESQLDILALGTVQRVKTVINSYATKNFLLKYFDFSLSSGAMEMQIKGAVVGKKIVLDIFTAGQSRKETILLKDPPYLSPNIKPAIVLLGLEQGRKYSFPLFNPATMSTEYATVTVEEKETIKIGDQEQLLYRLKESFQGMEATSWVTQDGETIKEESPLGYVLLKETMKEAMKISKEGPLVDVISLAMIPSGSITQSAEVKHLKVRLRGVDLQGFQLDGDRQVKGNNELVDITVDAAESSYRLPYPARDHAAELQASALVQSDDRVIREQAKKILDKETDARAAAKLLNTWVYGAIRKQSVVSIPSALEVLSQLVGDCNEHTTLYTALARAAGIPTRMAAGVVYMKNGFYYHAWPEIWLGKWIAVDPTFNQFPADATHIRFVTGDLGSQSSIMRLVGKLKIDIVEYR